MSSDFIHFIATEWPWVLALGLAVMLGALAERQSHPKRRWDGGHSRRPQWQPDAPPLGRGGWRGRPRQNDGISLDVLVARTEQRQNDPNAAQVPFDPAQQLREVEVATFSPRKILNRGEARLYSVLCNAIEEMGLGWRVMAQVSLGEILASPSEAAYRAINSKRVDLLLVCAQGNPLHAVEFQGSGHHLGPAATRDAIKREALRKAGIGFIEVMPGDTPAEIRARLMTVSLRADAA
ncbi:DUF2726 domain-containing protein [Sphingomonas sp. SFZ2018-12]|uniref:DUF2726 domain-containing protein n=1 Tax=Sphingomonas sp. SFZ2018-12 TaxID=2683197 RepID=UPI001F0CEF03|nr:DUF2726 domain-containing protein [Sphingomonas sp. SFZ2018-12]MCH4891927.1 DUF2726 domain-containing protein [Sphingomonas sp. SFZ2018-12]